MLMGHYSIALSRLLVIGVGVGGCSVLLYVHRNCRRIRDGSPGWPPRLSLSSVGGGGGGARDYVLVHCNVIPSIIGNGWGLGGECRCTLL